jgi:hypothetical protein
MSHSAYKMQGRAWTLAAELYAVPNVQEGLVLQIHKSDHTPYPRYRFTLGYKSADGFTHRGFMVSVQGQSVSAPVIGPAISDASALLQRGDAWLREDALQESALVASRRG